MGQYFKIVNEDKKEIVDPWKINGSAKFLEWLYSKQARVLVWLLRKSDGDGGGDIHEAEREKYKTLGRWAGDRISLVGDYDSSGLYDKATKKYTDISPLLLQEFNRAIKADGFQEEKL